MYASLKNFFEFCSPENRTRFYKSLFLSFIIAICEAMKFVAIGIVLQGFFENKMSGSVILTALAMLVIAAIVQSLVNAKSLMLQCVAGYTECANKRIEIAQHLRFLPMGYFNNNSIGEISSVTTNSMETLGDIATRVVLLLSQSILNTTAIILCIFVFDWRVGLIAVVGICLFSCVNHSMRKANLSLLDKKVITDTNLVSQVLEYIKGIGEVKAYKITGDTRKKLNDTIDEVADANIEVELSANKYIPLQKTILKLTGVAIAFAGVCFYLNETMSITTAIVMIIFSFFVFKSLEQLGSFSALLRIVDISVKRAQDILNLPTMDIMGEDIEPNNRDIKLSNIDFSYDNRKIINGISLTIPDNTSAAFVGPSGSGKTTLCKLIARFWDVDCGKVSLGSKDVKDYSMDSLMKNFSFVFQKVYLFHDTIANNIRFSKPDAPMEEVIKAAKLACCHDFISQLPDGYETIVGESGGSLSGGERQRISIARAIMKDSPVIILDEATANVDPENEKDLMDAISALTKDKTVIMIAHRLKTVQDADQIFVVDDGKIVQQGTHEELLQEEGIYKRFINVRAEAVSWKING